MHLRLYTPSKGSYIGHLSYALRAYTSHLRLYWTRKGDMEVDLVGAEKKVRPKRVAFAGSIKWRERAPFGGRDLGRIAAQRGEVPGTDENTVLVGVSREGFDEQGRGVEVALGPEDLLEAWK